MRAGLRIVLLSQELRQTADELKLANAELEAARSLPVRIIEQMPACSICRKIRDDDGKWLDVLAFLVAHDLAEFTHGVCPSCRTQHYPNVADPGTKAQG